MNRLEKILANPLYWEYLERNRQAEVERTFCKHNWEHLALTAQLTNQLLRERNLLNQIAAEPLTQLEIIGAAGVLHDIGRWQQYLTGRDHAELGSQLAPELLAPAGYTEAEIQLICQAILEHNKEKTAQSILGQNLALADDLSRPCFSCSAQEGCYKMPGLLERQAQMGYADFTGDQQEKFWRCLIQNEQNYSEN